MKLANKIRISDVSDNKLKMDLTSNMDDQTIRACTSDVDLLTKLNTPTIMSQTSCSITADIEKKL